MNFRRFAITLLPLTGVCGGGKISIHEAYRAAKAANPQSCESVYYGLFTDGKTEKKTFDGDGMNSAPGSIPLPSEAEVESLSGQAMRTEAQVKKIYNKHLLKLPLFSAHPAIAAELSARIKRTPVLVNQDKLDDPYGAFLAYPNDAGPTSYKMLRPGTLIGVNVDGVGIHTFDKDEASPKLLLGNGLLSATKSQAAIAFRLGHELAHTIEWAPDDLILCLGSEASIGARRSPRKITHEELPQPEANVPPPKTPAPVKHMNFDSGDGTKGTVAADRLISEGRFGDAEKLVKTSEHPPQMNEAVADYYATIVATKFIEKNYEGKNARRNAALAILFSLPPQLYDEKSAKLMNEAGSKQTNERRVFNLILANKEFRNLIGCEMRQSPAPRPCP